MTKLYEEDEYLEHLLLAGNIPNLSLGNLLLYVAKQVMDEREISSEEAEVIKTQYVHRYEALNKERIKLLEILKTPVSIKTKKPIKRFKKIIVTNKLEKLTSMVGKKVISNRELQVLKKVNPELAVTFLEKRQEILGGKTPNASSLRNESVDLIIYTPVSRRTNLVAIIEKCSKTIESSSFKLPWYILQDVAKRRKDEPDREKRSKVTYRLHKGRLYDLAGLTFIDLADEKYQSTVSELVHRALNRNRNVSIYKMKCHTLSEGGHSALHIRAKYQLHSELVDKRNADFVEIQLMNLVDSVNYEFGPESHGLYKDRQQRWADHKSSGLRDYLYEEDFKLQIQIQNKLMRILTA